MLKQEVRDWKDVQIPILADDQGLDMLASSAMTEASESLVEVKSMMMPFCPRF